MSRLLVVFKCEVKTYHWIFSNLQKNARYIKWTNSALRLMPR
jgi:hypothetical protein